MSSMVYYNMRASHRAFPRKRIIADSVCVNYTKIIADTNRSIGSHKPKCGITFVFTADPNSLYTDWIVQMTVKRVNIGHQNIMLQKIEACVKQFLSCVKLPQALATTELARCPDLVARAPIKEIAETSKINGQVTSTQSTNIWKGLTASRQADPAHVAWIADGKAKDAAFSIREIAAVEAMIAQEHAAEIAASSSATNAVNQAVRFSDHMRMRQTKAAVSAARRAVAAEVKQAETAATAAATEVTRRITAARRCEEMQRLADIASAKAAVEVEKSLRANARLAASLAQVFAHVEEVSDDTVTDWDDTSDSDEHYSTETYMALLLPLRH